MRYLIILIIFLISFNAYADQNDNRLDQLFKALLHSQNGYEINIITAEIWKIWGETDDLIILDDFKKGVKLMQSRQLIKALTFFSKALRPWQPAINLILSSLLTSFMLSIFVKQKLFKILISKVSTKLELSIDPINSRAYH